MTSLRIMAFMTLAAGLLAVCEGFATGEDSTGATAAPDATAARKISELEDQIVELTKQVEAAGPAKICDPGEDFGLRETGDPAKISECVDACTDLLLNFRAKGKYSSPPGSPQLSRMGTFENECGESCNGCCNSCNSCNGVYDYNELYEAYPEAAAQNWVHLYPFSCQIACHAKTCPARTRCRELGDAVHNANKLEENDENVVTQDKAFEAWDSEYPAAVAALEEGMAFGCLGLCDDDGDDTVLMMYYMHFKGAWDHADEPLNLSYELDDDTGKEVEHDIFGNEDLKSGDKFSNVTRAWDEAYSAFNNLNKDTSFEA